MIKNKKQAIKETLKAVLLIVSIIISVILTVLFVVVGLFHNSKYVDSHLTWIFPFVIFMGPIIFLLISFVVFLIKDYYEEMQEEQIKEQIEDEIFIEMGKDICINQLHYEDVNELLNAVTDDEILYIKNRIKCQIKNRIKKDDLKYIYASYKKEKEF